MLPAASVSVADSVIAFPTPRVTLFGVIATAATGTSLTVTFAKPGTPSITAVITAFPGSSAVTRPDCEIAATVALLVVQTTVRPTMAAPRLSYGVATRPVVAATTRSTSDGTIATDATRAGAATTVTLETSDLPSAVAAMSA